MRRQEREVSQANKIAYEATALRSYGAQAFRILEMLSPYTLKKLNPTLLEIAAPQAAAAQSVGTSDRALERPRAGHGLGV